ncbi:hypothetical protein EU803_08255 [Loktanella sp. IMCC34160]|uniref:hypothetical protein n=1 Tax=Loktanella sp. IMCC34160 TaxID=2510646 RepID=UPI00101D952E|nr:hypothetical protein [Loktanella sp. IMCC34160]RYG91084.1 hypothetical protein EU803_08255 [Loktanella sp. IMCC34160]
MSKTRLQFDVKDDRIHEIKALMKDIGADSNRELFNNALTLLEWAVSEVKNGNTIASINEANQVYRELQMPALNAAATRAKLQARSGQSNSSEKSRSENLAHGYG